MASTPLLPAIQKEVDRIKKELGCTEAEAYFTLRSLVNPPSDAFFERRPEILGGPARDSRKRALSFTRDLLAKLEEYRVKVEAGKFAAFFRALQVCGATGFPLPMWIRERIGKAHHAYSGHVAATTDEALGAKRPRHYRQDRARRDASSVPWDVYSRCRELLMAGGKTPYVFEDVAREYGLAKTTVSGYYYALRPRPPKG